MRETELGVLSVVLGLRYKPELIQKLVEDAMFKLEDSSMYQFILEKGIKDGLQAGREKGLTEGRAEGRREEITQGILRLGTKRFGDAPKSILKALKSTTDLTKLEAIHDRLLDATDWKSLVSPQ